MPSPVYDALRSSGQSLDAATRTHMESRFSHDFSRVRVHTDQRAVESAHAVNALAYTVGQHIFFGAGQYAPQTRAGQSLLTHELTHTIQQSAARQDESHALQTTDTSSAAEQEAATMATAIMHGQTFTPMQHQPRQLARQPVSPTTPAPAPPRTDNDVMNEAAAEAVKLMTDALSRIYDLRSQLDQLRPVTDPVMQNTLRAVQTWLHINVVAMGETQFIFALDRAINLIKANIAVKAKGERRAQRTPPCTQPDFARAFVGLPNIPIRVCDRFFAAGPQCQRNVMIHERFHLVGVHHGEAGARKAPPTTTTLEQSLDSADDLMDMVKDVMGQPITACPNL